MRYYIITGEPSGDLHAANLVNELKKIDHNAVIRAWGGERLIAEDVSLAKNINETAFMGVWSVLKNLRTISNNLNFCKEDILAFKADVIILVDYPGFNLKIANFAKKKGLKVVYYISPKVWAWNQNKILKIKRFVDHVLVIFPFEVEFYKKHGVVVNYVGNPLLDEIKKNNFSFTLKTSKDIIALLPGSRKQEIDLILPEMLKIVESYDSYQFVIAANNNFSKEYYNSFINGKDVELVFNETYGLLSRAKAALVTSGTATLESALFKVPQVVCYKTNWLTYFIAKYLIKIEYLSLVNILLGKKVVSELIQKNLNEQNIKKELDILLLDRNDILIDYKKVSALLTKQGASKNAAEFILSSF